MNDILKDEKIVAKVGGAFRLTALIQRRMKEIIEGARPLVPTEGKKLFDIVLQEIKEDKIAIDYDKTPTLNQVDNTGLQIKPPAIDQSNL